MPGTVGPQFHQIDAWGLTHIGKVRATNQDHYLTGHLAAGLMVEDTSLAEGYSVEPLRLASLAIVADGVGRSPGGEKAARAAVEALAGEVSRSFHEAEFAEATDPEAFSRLLQDAALACHESLLKRGKEEGSHGHFATTLTLFLGLWPEAYVLQVGDSRAYIFRDDELQQITRDQTWAQDLIEQGTLTQTKAMSSKWANVLSSAIGGQEAAPVVTRITRDWGAVLLFCTDGLTKHVPDEQIADMIRNMKNARQLAEDLLQAALDEGGTDNITLVVGRSLKGTEL